MLPLRALALAALVVLPRLAAAGIPAGSAADVTCETGSGPSLCLVSKAYDVTAGSTLDFGSKELRLQGATFNLPTGGSYVLTVGKLTVRTGSTINGLGGVTLTLTAPDGVEIQRGGRIDVGPGTAMVTSGPVLLAPGGQFDGNGGTIVVAATGDVAVQKSGSTTAEIDVSGVIAGYLGITATGAITVQGNVDAHGGAVDSDGGQVELSGNGVSVSGTIDAHAARLGGGGQVNVDGGLLGIVVPGTIDVSGGYPGGISLDAGTDVTTTGILDGSAVGEDGGDGQIEITAEGTVSLGGNVRLDGEAGATEFGGNGGYLSVTAGGSIYLTATVAASGAAKSGAGGDLAFFAGADIIQTGTLTVLGRGSDSDGATVAFEAQRSLTLGDIDARGGTNAASGADVDATAWCTITVPTGVTVNTQGAAGTTTLRAGSGILVQGTLKAGASNVLQRLPGKTVTITGAAVVSPTAVIQDNDQLTPCGGKPVPGCGDGSVNSGLGEACDDANTTACDGCSASCQLETCGNGTVECSEACDDGNTTPGDGCNASCVVEACGNGTVDAGEQCDDSNTAACDGCSATCGNETCGNGIVDCGETCDPGPGDTDTCVSCQLVASASCGDGTIDPGEECDDHNQVDGDGCNALCFVEACGNGTVDAGEACDDGDTSPCDGCDALCRVESCGNARLDCGETCDEGDANGTVSSGCLAETCQTGGSTCTPDVTGPCLACEAAVDCSPLAACGDAACVAGVCEPVEAPSCDDGNPCTDDACSPASGCVHTDHACDDGNACNGSDSCDPAVGCVAGPAPACDDGDACTDDLCDDVAGCGHSDRTGVASVLCRLDNLEALLGDAGVGAKTRTKVTKILSPLRTKLRAGDGTTKPAKKARKAAGRLLAKLQKTVAKPKDVTGDVGQSLRDAVTGARGALAHLG